MALIGKFSTSAGTSLVYITVGALTLVWTGVHYAFLLHNPPQNESSWYWTYGFLGTGTVLLLIGFSLGWIGRQARHAELPPPEVTPAEAQIQQTAAAHPPVVANAPAVAPGQAPAGAVAAPVPNPTAAPQVYGNQMPVQR